MMVGMNISGQETKLLPSMELEGLGAIIGLTLGSPKFQGARLSLSIPVRV
jgi:hypothetical protein